MLETIRTSQDGLLISRATRENVSAIKSMIDAAFSKYIERIGKPPAPMSTDYYAVVQTQHVYILQDKGKNTVGAIVLDLDSASHSVEINNLVVDPKAQGHGYGRVLMNYAEDYALSEGCSSLTLYTNVKMYENLELYAKLGFVETGRGTEDGFERVYFRKDLS